MVGVEYFCLYGMSRVSESLYLRAIIIWIGVLSGRSLDKKWSRSEVLHLIAREFWHWYMWSVVSTLCLHLGHIGVGWRPWWLMVEKVGIQSCISLTWEARCKGLSCKRKWPSAVVLSHCNLARLILCFYMRYCVAALKLSDIPVKFPVNLCSCGLL